MYSIRFALALILTCLAACNTSQSDNATKAPSSPNKEAAPPQDEQNNNSSSNSSGGTANANCVDLSGEYVRSDGHPERNPPVHLLVEQKNCDSITFTVVDPTTHQPLTGHSTSQAMDPFGTELALLQLCTGNGNINGYTATYYNSFSFPLTGQADYDLHPSMGYARCRLQAVSNRDGKMAVMVQYYSFSRDYRSDCSSTSDQKEVIIFDKGANADGHAVLSTRSISLPDYILGNY